MNHKLFFWLGLNVFCIIIHGFFAMMEMASVSFNKVRLHYYVSKGYKRAKWLSFLIRQPHRLFGTIILVVNIALQIGSQSARESFINIGIKPGLAPFIQVILVVICAELIPISLSRKCPEHIAMLGAPILYFAYYIFYPFTKILGIFTKFLYFIFKINANDLDTILSRDDFQKALENHHEENEFNIIATNIFSLSSTPAHKIMEKITELVSLNDTSSIADLKRVIKNNNSKFVPIYNTNVNNIIGIVIPKELTNKNDHIMIKEVYKKPWFIDSDSSLSDIIKDFKINKKEVAIVLNKFGLGIGIISLDDIVRSIFGHVNHK